MNKDAIARRIKELKDNYEAGQMQVRRLEAQQRELQQTLLRISGAIQVLEELLQEPGLEGLQGREGLDGQERLEIRPSDFPPASPDTGI